MRELTFRALLWMLDAVLPARGRHRAYERPPAAFVICAPRTPVPAHVLMRTVPVREPVRIPPYLGDWITRQEAEWERQRHVSVTAATPGHDVPFAVDGSAAAPVSVAA
jgi:hypothetical protein